MHDEHADRMAEIMADARRLQAEHGARLIRDLGRRLRDALAHPVAARSHGQLKPR